MNENIEKPKQVNPNTAPPHEFLKYVDELETYVNKLEKQIRYTKEDVIKAGEMGGINHYDTEHIVSYLDEAREKTMKIYITKILIIFVYSLEFPFKKYPLLKQG